MIDLLPAVLWLAVPAVLGGVSHMVVVKKDLFPALKVPLDGGATLGGRRLFGDNKTWRGALYMVAASTLAGLAQAPLAGWAEGAGLDLVGYARVGAKVGLGAAGGYALVGLLQGVGYVLGELPNSFVKRRIDITPGKTGAGPLGALFFLVDQADSIVGFLLVACVVWVPPLRVAVAIVFWLTALHIALNLLLYLARVRRNV